MRRRKSRVRLVPLFLFFALFLLSACGGGGGGDDGDAPPPPSDGGGWITILAPQASSPYETYCDSIYLAGEAFISSDYFRCCSGSAEDTGVEVVWRNSSTGEGGAATQRVQVCNFFGTPFLCNHEWSVTVPLRLGSNTIVLRASEVSPGTAWGEAEFVVEVPEPSYAVSGSLMTSDGRPLWWYESGIELRLEDADSSTRALSNPDGTYRFGCVRNGDYELSPSAPLGQSYTPDVAFVTVGGGDVSGVDFQTESYFVSGTVTWAVSGAPVTNKGVRIESGGMSISTRTDDQGAYRLAAPNGSYSVSVYDAVFPDPPGTFSPEAQSVTVAGSDVEGIDFVRN